MKENQKKLKPHDAPLRDKRLGRMVMLSGLLHVVLLLVLVSAAKRPQSKTLPPQTYTVSLVAPAALGLSSARPPAPSSKKTESVVVSPLPKPELPKPPKVKNEPKKPRVNKKVHTEKKTKPKVVKPQKKKQAVKIASKKTLKLKKKPPKKGEEKTSQRKKNVVKKTLQKPSSPQKRRDQQITAEERDRQISAALGKIRQHVKSDQAQLATPRTPNSGQGDAGGGSTPVRGLAFIMYTEEVKRRVKQGWIVAEQKPGLTAMVRFGILANGEVVNIALAERSGSMVFDESAMRAVRKASPLPPPPEAYRNEFTRQQVEVVFGETRRVQSREAWSN